MFSLLGVRLWCWFSRNNHTTDIGNPFAIQVKVVDELFPIGMLKKPVRDRMDMDFPGVLIS